MRTEKKRLTSTILRMKAPEDVKRLEIRDTASPLLFRITRNGERSLSLRTTVNGQQARFLWSGEINPTTDQVPDLAEVRAWAGDIVAQCKKGIDPRLKEEDARRQQQEEQRRLEEAQRKEEERTANTFAAVVERWLLLVVVGPDQTKPKQRQGLKVARETRNHLVKRWGKKPLDEVTRKDVIALVDDLEGRGTPALARNVLGHARTFFNWCISRDLLEHSPADRVKLSTRKRTRQRVLDDLEIRAFWRAAHRVAYPYSQFYRMLLLTGQRREEVAAATWREFHPELVSLLRKREEGQRIDWSHVSDDYKLWTVGQERFKSDAPNLVPLTDTVCELLEELPFWRGGDYLLTTTHGRLAINGFSKPKRDLDGRITRTLKAWARLRGDDPRQVELENFTHHDLRRTMRTRMASLRIMDETAEKCIGHGRKGLQRVYDQHRYLPEMREAFGVWHRKVDALVTPAADNVIRMRVS